MKNTNHHRDRTKTTGPSEVRAACSCSVSTHPSHDHASTAVVQDKANATLLIADLRRWLAQYDVHPDALLAFMEQVATAVAFQGIVGAHPAHIESSLSSEARRDLAVIVATDVARQRRP